jgi:tRNA(Ile)-lysidine synthase
MYVLFLKYALREKLFTPAQKILLAVSGGMDSMAMAHLFLRSGLKAGVAHCNFGLRGDESDADEAFVKQWADTHKLPFFNIRFDTKNYAAAHNLSTQMAARTLRYTWFDSLANTHAYDRIAVAHHADDNAETVVLNLTRGTGLKGVCGIAPLNGRIIRPLLYASREQISRYITDHHILFREDRSNASDDYARNRIRHHVMPVLKTLNPSLADTFRHNSEYLSQACRVLTDIVEQHKAKWCTPHRDEWHIDVHAIRQTDAPAFWLFELLQDFGFNSAQVNDISIAIAKQPGKRFFSPTHELLKDRDKLIIIQRNDTHEASHLTFERIPNNPPLSISKDKNTAFLDADKLQLPLTVRPWRDGDAFVPLGMKGKKKLSDYFIDNKIPRHLKTRQWVAVSGDDIVWLVGQRPDERYKITPQTQYILKITWNENLPGSK